MHRLLDIMTLWILWACLSAGCLVVDAGYRDGTEVDGEGSADLPSPPPGFAFNNYESVVVEFDLAARHPAISAAAGEGDVTFLKLYLRHNGRVQDLYIGRYAAGSILRVPLSLRRGDTIVHYEAFSVSGERVEGSL